LKKIIFSLFTINVLFAYTYDYKNLNLKCKKVTCSKIKTCKEAYFYLEVCGFKRLDRDKDSIPCEKLCK
jgi:hypothetical protein